MLHIHASILKQADHLDVMFCPVVISRDVVYDPCWLWSSLFEDIITSL